MSRKNNSNNKSTGGRSKNAQKSDFTGPLPKNQSRSAGNRANVKSKNLSKRSSAPNAMSNRQVVGRAKMSMSKDGHMSVQHRELISSISQQNGGGFNQIVRLRCNPSSQQTFAWLSTIAPSFETFKFRYLRFRYIPRCSTLTSGSVLMLPDYDAADTRPLTELTACQHVNAVEDTLWTELVCTLDVAALNRAYKSHFNVTDSRFANTSQDAKTIDPAQFFLFIDSTTTGVTFGKLWVEYDVDLMTPQPAEVPIEQGGAGTNKNAGIAINSVLPFTSSSLSTDLEETNPILAKFAGPFPSQNLFSFNRDWSGYMDKSATGAGLSDVGAILKNGLDIITDPSYVQTIPQIFDAAGANISKQIFSTWKQGDILGSGSITGTSISNLIHNLGGSSIY